MASPTIPSTREATTPAMGGGLCLLSTAKKDNDDDLLQPDISKINP